MIELFENIEKDLSDFLDKVYKKESEENDKEVIEFLNEDDIEEI